MFLIGCEAETTNEIKRASVEPLSFQAMKKVDSEASGLDFNNKITEDERFNIIRYDGLLQGAGVGILDVNNDGLMDVYYAGNLVGDRLYLNKGDLKFEDITGKAGITGGESWSTGISIVDINGDGFDDIYVCKFLYDGKGERDNHLFINQKNNTFKEEARAYGLADPGYGITANFFDFDRDGDLDVYVANQPPNNLELKGKLEGKRDASFTDRLYRNDGGKFVNITGAAKTTNYTYSLSAITFDYNNDGWQDIYVACDYEEPDILYKNNGDGTFTNVIHEAFDHISNFSMGSDIADINRDGNLDLFVVDMVAEDNYRQKTNMSGMNPEKFWGLANAGYHYQYMYNAMQLNNGNETFSEIAHMGGISSTDWSWTPLFIDFDLDGYDDLFVTNGIIKEVRNKDYSNWRKEYVKKKKKSGEKLSDEELLLLSEKTPSVKVLDNLFRNKGNLKFQHVESEWGVHDPSWSQGAAYADFDNDGDLDIVINNMNSKSIFYENSGAQLSGNNFLNITLNGKGGNSKGIGALIKVYTESGVKVGQVISCRGYMSSSQPICNFGLGQEERIEKVEVIWPNGVIKEYKSGLKVNRLITLNEEEGKEIQPSSKNIAAKFSRINQKITHEEDNYDDYKKEVLIPHKMSTLGPFVTKGDVNGDGNDDFFMTGSAGNCGQLSIYNKTTNQFDIHTAPWCQDKDHEDGGAQLVDLDKDGDLDLIVTSGGNQFNEGSPLYKSRAYINDGNGGFSKLKNWPGDNISSGPIQPLDFDQDGDVDVFIGGRQVPGKYGRPASSQLIENLGDGKFKNVSDKHSIFKNMGMVSGAAWQTSADNKNNLLIVVGDWMPVTILEYVADDWIKSDLGSELNLTNGWWNTVVSANMDEDDEDEILLGNAGTNLKYKASLEKPFKAFVDDFDQNGTNDVYLGQVFNDGNYYPVRGRQCSSEQMPFIKKEFKNYDVFASTTFENILGERIDSTSILNEVHTFNSGYLDLDSTGKYRFYPFPNEAQKSPTFAFVNMDIDNDGKKEIIGAGNYYNREVETTRSDAGVGYVLKQSNNKLHIESLTQYGIDASGDVRFIEKLERKGSGPIVIVGVNNGNVRIYSGK